MINKEISKYNLVNKNIADEYKVQYINTTLPAETEMDEELLAPDKLHPSGKEYQRWAQLVAEEIQSLIVYDAQEYQ